jgi:hypothetical protein
MGIKELRQVFGLDPRKPRAAQIILIIGSVPIEVYSFPKWETPPVGVFRDHR